MNATPSAVYSRTRDQLLVGRKARVLGGSESGIESLSGPWESRRSLFLKSGEGMNATQLSAEVLRSGSDVLQARGMQHVCSNNCSISVWCSAMSGHSGSRKVSGYTKYCIAPGTCGAELLMGLARCPGRERLVLTWAEEHLMSL